MIQSLASTDDRIQAIRRHEQPKGANSCRNIGVNSSNSDWLIFLDSDDLLGPDCLRQRLDFARNTVNDEIYYFPTVIFKEDPDQGKLWNDQENPMPWLQSLLLGVPPCQSTGPFWPRSAWDKFGGWDPKIGVWQDIELHARAHWDGAVFIAAIGAQPDVFHRISDDSISRVGFHSQEKLESRLFVIEKCWARIQQHGAAESERKAMATMTLSALRNAASLGLFDKINAMLANPDFMLSKEELALAHRILRCRRWKLDRIPQLRRQIQRQWTQCFPPSGRRLGRQRWTQKTK